MNTVKILFGILFFGSMISCSDAPVTLDDVSFSYYTIEIKQDYDSADAEDTQSLQKGYLEDNKLMSIYQVEANSLEKELAHYEYENGLLRLYSSINGEEIYFYDNQNRIVGVEKKYIDLNRIDYERFIYKPDNVVYCEKLNLPYNDSNAKITWRNILEFDSNNNVVKAGYDDDLDGDLENVNGSMFNVFEYKNNNLVIDGSELIYGYKDVKDNFSFIYDNTYGKKNRRVLSSDYFSTGYFYNVNSSSGVFNIFHGISFNQNIVNTQFDDGTIYDVLNSKFYNQRYTNLEFGAYVNVGNETTTTHFFFN